MDVEVTGGEHPSRSGELWGREGTEEGEETRKFGGGVRIKEWGELCNGVDHRVSVCGRRLRMDGGSHEGFKQCSGLSFEQSRVIEG
jgi:hypothetical protein